MDGCRCLGWNRGWMDKMDLDGNPMVWGNPLKSRQYHHPRAETGLPIRK